MTATLTLEQYPQSAANVTTTGSITSTTEKIDVRGRGRAVKIKYETNTVDDTAWRLGSTKLQLRPDGKKIMARIKANNYTITYANATPEYDARLLC